MNKKVNLFFNICLALFCVTACSNKVVVGPQGPQGEQGIPGEDGKDGQDGTSILTGNGLPYSTLGKDGDSYIDLDTWNYYIKENDSWVLKGNIKGSDGAPGQDGKDGVDGKDGQDGQDGQDGTDGTNGTNGTDGQDGVSITNTYIDDNGDLIIEYSDGTSTNAGHLKDSQKCTVRFHVDDEIIATKEVLVNFKVSRPSLTETAGYTITDWYYLDGSVHESWKFFGYVITEDTDLYAEFTYNTYTISFVDDVYNNVVESISVHYDNNYILPVCEHTGYTCVWLDSNNKPFSNSGVYRIANNLNLHASWEANSYSVTLNADGGIVEQDNIIVTFDKEYVLPLPTKSHYHFMGWYDNDTKISNNATWKYDENKLLVARWTTQESLYVLDAGDGTCSIDSIVIPYDSNYELPIPIKDGYEFIGWYLDDTYIPISGTWVYENGSGELGGILKAEYISQNLTYGVSSDKSYIKSCEATTVGTVVIPSKIFGLPVVEISGTAFWKSPNIEEIILPDTIEKIGVNVQGSAFQNCSSLRFNEYKHGYYLGNSNHPYLWLVKISSTIEIHSETKHIYDGLNCNNLVSITIPNSVVSFGRAFAGASNLKSIIIGTGIMEIERFAFSNCTKLVSVSLPDTIKKLDYESFSGCSSLASIFLPKSITELGSNVFKNCTSLKDIVFEEGITTTGVQTFWGCTSLEEARVPSSVGKIGYGLFRGCTSLTTVVIEEGITEIEPTSFWECSALELIVIPSTIIQIGESSYDGSGSITDFDTNKQASFYYFGTQNEWNTVNVPQNRDKERTVYFYSEIEPLESGNYWHYLNGCPVIW